MVLQYKLKSEVKWKDYPGKSKLKYSVNKDPLISENAPLDITKLFLAIFD